MMKTLFSTATVLTSALLLTGTASAQTFCPSEIILKSPRFLGNTQYPAFEQIRTNFVQRFHSPGRPDLQTWDENDLGAAHAFVAALKRNTQQDQVRLSSKANGGVCEGNLENFKFQVDASGLRFDLNFRNSVEIANQAHASVDFLISFPSDCSGCSGAAQLLEFQNINFR